jgi:hypothetical protein
MLKCDILEMKDDALRLLDRIARVERFATTRVYQRETENFRVTPFDKMAPFDDISGADVAAIKRTSLDLTRTMANARKTRPVRVPALRPGANIDETRG